MSSPARPQRNRKSNPRYATVAWDRDTLRRLRAASESSGSSPSDSDIPLDQSDDQEFDHRVDQTEGVSSEDGDLSVASDASSPSSGGVVDDEGLQPGRTPRAGVLRLPAPSSNLQSRGLKDVPKHQSKKSLYPLLFGPGQEDLAPISHVCEYWLNGRDITLPSRSTLAKPQSSYTYLTDQAEQTARHASNDADTGPQNRYLHRKDVKHLTKEATRINTSLEATDADLRQIHVVQRLKSINEAIAKAQRYVPIKLSQSIELGLSSTGQLDSIESPGCKPFGIPSAILQGDEAHQGWLLSLGEKVQALAWAPTLGSKQYLATTARCTPAQRDALGPPRSAFGPAFFPSTNYPSSIQLWSFDTTPTQDEDYHTLDLHKSPQLELVIGTLCGDIRYLEWAPVTSLNSDPLAPRMLAVLSSDSHVRILSLDFAPLTSQPAYLELERAAVDITPPSNPTSPMYVTGGEAVFTTICWASSRELLVGSSNGFVHTYDIFEGISSASPQPFFSYPIHGTYVMTLAYARPIVPFTGCPLASSSAGGELMLTDLRHPSSDTVVYSRARLPSKPLIWSPFARCWLTSYEPSARTSAEGTSSSMIACHHVRRFYSHSQIARLPPQSGSATNLAGSLHHPCILIANAGGDVFATNYLRKVLIDRPRTPAHGAFLQQICQYDWRPSSSPSDTASSTAKTSPATKDIFHGPPARSGCSRLTFGFQPESIDLTRGRPAPNTAVGSRGKKRTKTGGKGSLGEDEDGIDDGDIVMEGEDAEPAAQKKKSATAAKIGKKDQNKVEDDVDLTAAEVIFEEEQAVTALQWNVNRRAAGWAAVGWGSGIVMVRDLAVDV